MPRSRAPEAPPWPPPNGTCDVGHYAHACPTCDRHLRCAQYYVGNYTGTGTDTGTGTGTGTSIAPLDYVSGVDDEAFLVDRFVGNWRTSAYQPTPDKVR